MRRKQGASGLFVSLIGVLSLAQGCGDSPSTPRTPFDFSFEQGMEGWTAAAADTQDGQSHAPWSIARSTELAHEGQYSLKLHMDNFTDAAKIWIVRPFSVAPGDSYDVTVSYAFGTSDCCGLNNVFVLLTGVFLTPPTDGLSLVAGAPQDHTGNGADSDVGYVWLRKDFHIPVSSQAGSSLYVVVGVWGTWETPKTYYLDELSIQISPAPRSFLSRESAGQSQGPA